MIYVFGTAHTGDTPGKCSPDKRFREAVYSREILSEVNSVLKSYGYDSRIDFEPLDPLKDWKNLSYKIEQKRELKYRVDYVNKLCDRYGSKNVAYISFHTNAARSDNKWHEAGGFSVYTSRGETLGDELAECFYDSAEVNLLEYKERFIELQKEGEYGKLQKPIRQRMYHKYRSIESDLYVLKYTKCPACLIEAMFQDNKADVDYLLSEEGRFRMVRLLVEGVIMYERRRAGR